MTDDTRHQWEKAVAKAHSLSGRIASAEKATGKSAEIAEKTLPSMYREYDKALNDVAELQSQLKPLIVASAHFDVKWRTTTMSEEEAKTLEIPEFLRRASR